MDSTGFSAHKITDRVYWVGAMDWNVRDFHGYQTGRGTTYNAYLIVADKIALLDTVKSGFCSEMLSRISSVIDPRRIDYIISNHSEMDHSGCLPEMIKAVKPEAVFASAMGVKALAEHFHADLGIKSVKDGETLSLGSMTLSFMETRMLHWPDSMFSYLNEDRLLFSQDGFGMHVASHERFADEIAADIIEYESAKYYANILLPFAPKIAKILEKVAGTGWTLDTIAPDHGPVWRKDTNWILNKYRAWTERKPKRKAVVVFDTMWGSTEKLARAIAEGLADHSVDVKFMPLRVSHRSDVATEVLDATALVAGSPTLNDTLFPTMAETLTYLKGLKPKGLQGAVFGSYGWSAAAIDDMKRYFEEMKIGMIGEPLKVNYVPDDGALLRAYDWGKSLAKSIRH